MAELLEAEDAQMHNLHRGEVLEGTVVGHDREAIIVNVGAKSEGIVPPHEMQSLGHNPSSKLNEGDRIHVYVLQPETAEGQVLLSIDRARGETGWRDLQTRFENQDSFEIEIIGFNKGGVLCNVEGVNAFIPLSQLANIRPDPENANYLADSVGKKLRVKVIELNRRRNRVILSERAAMQEWRTAQKDKLMSELQEGQVRKGIITSIRDFGVFIDLGGADGLAHLSELSWDRDRAPTDLYKIGQEVDAFVMKVDPETKKIALSLRRAQPKQWDVLADRYQLGQVVVGKVTKLVPFGAFAQIEGQLEGLVHVSEISERKLNHPNEVLREGDILPLKIVRIERERHRLALSLKQARYEAEVRGYVFDNNGAVVLVPEYEQERLREEGITAPPWQRGLAGEPAPTDDAQATPGADATQLPEVAEEVEEQAPDETPVEAVAEPETDESEDAAVEPEAVSSELDAVEQADSPAKTEETPAESAPDPVAELEESTDAAVESDVQADQSVTGDGSGEPAEADPEATEAAAEASPVAAEPSAEGDPGAAEAPPAEGDDDSGQAPKTGVTVPVEAKA
ncbi:MAG: S1 RNA-binding domain-containing protein [Dehalococcoidia bacterium]